MAKNCPSLIKEDVWLKENEARVFLLKKKNFKELKKNKLKTRKHFIHEIVKKGYILIEYILFMISSMLWGLIRDS